VKGRVITDICVRMENEVVKRENKMEVIVEQYRQTGPIAF
jgi:hypothetical protein